jgi:hypothetical protein
MNGAQLLKAHGGSSELMNRPPAAPDSRFIIAPVDEGGEGRWGDGEDNGGWPTAWVKTD